MKKKSFTLKNPLGLSLRDNIEDTNNASYIKNMLPRDGGIRKRNGWRDLVSFKGVSIEDNPVINGIYGYNNSLIVHCGTALYRCSYDLSSIEKIKGEALENAKSQGVVAEQCLWILSNGAIYAYDGVLIKKEENRSPYIPTTLIKGKDKYNGMCGEPYQAPNILTKRRINKFIGADIRSSGVSYLMFYLDSPIKYGTSAKVTMEIRLRKSDDVDDLYTSPYVGIKYGEMEVNTVVKATYLIHSTEDGKVYYLTEPLKDKNGEEILVKHNGEIKNHESLSWNLLIRNGNELIISCNAISPTGEENISIEYEAEEASSLTNPRVLSMATLENGGQVLLACNGSNAVYYSDPVVGFTYIPTKNRMFIGGDISPVTAIKQIRDGTIGIYKGDSFFRVKIYEGQGAYSVYPTSDQYGAVSPYSIATLDYDTISLGKGAIYGISQSTDMLVSFLKCRSSNIEIELKKFTEEELSNAVACVFGDKYYLFIGGKVLVAHRDYKKSLGTQDSRYFEYEWWVLENCPAYTASVVNDTLYMGKENGTISAFYNGFEDISIKPLLAERGDVLFTEGEDYTKITFYGGLGVKDGDSVCLNPHFARFYVECSYASELGSIIIPHYGFFDFEEVAVFEGMEILVRDSLGQVVAEGTITEVDPVLCAIKCTGIYLSKDTEDLTIYVKRGRDYKYFVRRIGKDTVLTSATNGSVLMLLDHSIPCAYLQGAEPVECAFYTSPLSLNSFMEQKTLTSVFLKPLNGSRGEVKLGFKTRKNQEKRVIFLSSELDFDSVEFNSIGMLPDFDRAVRVSLFERDFDFIAFTAESTSAQDFGIGAIGCEYIEKAK